MSQYQHGNGSSQHNRGQQQHQHQQHRPTPPVRSASGRGFRRGSTWREANANGPPRRMEVSIPHKSLKVFAQAVQCLMKVGKELFIETTADQLILRTLNDAKSAFAAFYFNDSGGFFETCDVSKQGEGWGGGARGGGVSQESGFDENSQASRSSQQTADGGGSAASVSCKVLVRAVHSILRTLKKVVRLVIYVEGEDDQHIEPHLVFQMYCEFGYRKVHRFSLQDCEIMHAVFEGEGAARLSCPPVQLSQLLEHIHGTAEVAVGASHDILTVRSYHHPLTGSAERSVLKTEMSISTAEFDTYKFFGADDEEVELVFSLKEIKALLHFSETTEALTLEMLFREGGDPLLFQSNSNTFAAELIMATMEPKIIVRKEHTAAPAPAAAVEVVKADSGKIVAGAGGGAEGGEEGEGEGDHRGGGGVGGARDRGDDVGGGDGMGPGPGRRGPGDGGGGGSQDSEATRTPALEVQHFDNDPFGERPPAPAGDGFAAGYDLRNGGGDIGGGEGPNGTYEDDERGGRGGGGGAPGNEDERDCGERQHHANDHHQHQHQHRYQDRPEGSFQDEEDGHDGRRRQRRRRQRSGSSGDAGEERNNDRGGGRGSTPAESGEETGQDYDYDEVPETEAQRESELPTQFPGVRDAFESELPTQHLGTTGRGVGAVNGGDDYQGDGGGRGVARDGGAGRGEDDEDDGGAVQGSKRRRFVEEQDEDEEEEEE
eukprot:g12869.t2